MKLRTVLAGLAIFSGMIVLSNAVPQVASPTAYIAWLAPMHYVDGVELPPENIAYFTVYYGPDSGTYTYQWQLSSVDREGYIPLPTIGKWYFAMTATDMGGEESTYSNEVMRELTNSTGKRPVKLKIQLVATR